MRQNTKFATLEKEKFMPLLVPDSVILTEVVKKRLIGFLHGDNKGEHGP